MQFTNEFVGALDVTDKCIVICNCLHYSSLLELYNFTRSLQTLLPNRGLNKTRLTIFIQDYYEQVQELAALLNIRVVVKTTASNVQVSMFTRLLFAL